MRLQVLIHAERRLENQLLVRRGQVERLVARDLELDLGARLGGVRKGEARRRVQLVQCTQASANIPEHTSAATTRIEPESPRATVVGAAARHVCDLDK